MSGRAGDPARGRAHRAARARGSRRAARGRGRDRLSRDHAQLRSGSVNDCVQDDRDREGQSRAGLRRRRCDRRRRVPLRTSGAALHRNQWRDRRAGGRRRDHRVRIDAVSVLRASGVDGRARSSRQARARGANGDRRRVRREGRVSLGDCLPCGAAGAQIWPAREARVRPRRGHARDDEAAPFSDSTSDRRHTRRPAHRDRHRRRLRRRRLRHPERRGAVARHDPRERSVSLRSHPHPWAGDDDEYAAQWSVPRLRRAAVAVCDRSAHGSDRGAPQHRSRAAPRDQRAAAGRHDGNRSASREGLQRAGGAAGSGEADGFQAQAKRVCETYS